jgi:hypothetical protein
MMDQVGRVCGGCIRGHVSLWIQTSTLCRHDTQTGTVKSMWVMETKTKGDESPKQAGRLHEMKIILTGTLRVKLIVKV